MSWIVAKPPNSPEYIMLMFEGKPGHLVIKATDEGYVVDFWAENNDGSDPVTSTWVTYTEMESEE